MYLLISCHHLIMILKATPDNIDYCAGLLQQDEVIGVPTETVYGLAGNALKENSVRKIFQIKGRPLIDPLIVHCKSLEVGESIAALNDTARSLAKAFWPGPLTVIVPKGKQVPDLVTAGLSSVAIRVPRHPVFRALLESIDFPLAAPSANPFGYVSPTSAEHVERTLGSKIKAILDGHACAIGLESTIVDLREPETPIILRHGPISGSQISDCLGFKVGTRHAEKSDLNTAQSAPGQLSKHYSPRATVDLLEHGSIISKESVFSRLNDETALVCNQKPDWYAGQQAVYWLSTKGNLDEMARSLFDLIQTLDEQQFKKIYVEQAPDKGLGVAINDRLRRAAAKVTTQV